MTPDTLQALLARPDLPRLAQKINEASVEQYSLRNGVYELAQKLKQGEIDSLVVAGFRIPIAAIFDDQRFHAALTELLN